MKIKFISVPGEQHDEITMYGVTFPLGKAVSVDHLAEGVKRRLSHHPHFEASGADVQDIAFKELPAESKGDGAQQLADTQAEFDIATAQLAGKDPAPNAKEGLAEEQSAETTKEDLFIQAEAMGVDVKKSWGVDRLKAEIEKAAK